MVGAGAAGTMAAIFAAAADADVRLYERTPDGGRKILISGGGRCNVLPVRIEESRFVTDSSPASLRKMVRSWPLPDQIAFFEREVGIPLAEETASGKLFPVSNRARDVRDGLFGLARRRGVEILTGALVTNVLPDDRGWRIERTGSPPAAVDAVVVATGGLSIPLSGSDGLGLSILAKLGHTIHPTYAALTPLVHRSPAGGESPFGHLAGVSLSVRTAARGGGRAARSSGGLLFTHGGYSGPAILDVSHVAVRSLAGGPPARVEVCWTERSAADWDAALRTEGHRTVAGVLRSELPDRLAAALAATARVDPSRTLAQLQRAERLRLVESLVRGELPWTGHGGYAKAEVTGGGVDLAEVNPRTMESRRHPGLFICGEALDAFGPIGGYNFLWAWATGRAAGVGAAAEIPQGS